MLTINVQNNCYRHKFTVIVFTVTSLTLLQVLTYHRYRFNLLLGHIIGHFGDDVPSQTIDWCKAGCESNQTATRLHKQAIEN